MKEISMKGGLKMLEHLRQRASLVMASTRTVTLATCGPAGIQSDLLPCRTIHQRLYLLIPRTSDQLLNIEHRADLLVTADRWQLSGRGRILAEAGVPAFLLAERLPEAAWSTWVVITPQRLTVLDADKKCFETIDFDIPGGNDD